MYCGQDREFFKNNRVVIDNNNLKIAFAINIVMLFVVLAFFIFNFNSLGSNNIRYVYLGSFAVLFALVFFKIIIIDKFQKFKSIYAFFVTDLCFVLILIIETIFHTTTAAVFLPVYFALFNMILISSLVNMISIGILNYAISTILIIIFKERSLVIFDTVNILTSFFVGVFVGYFVLHARTEAINSYNLLKKNSESELTKALVAANTDSLTGVNSRSAYERDEAKLDDLLKKDEINKFGVVVIDINDLKNTNDNKGHDEGDKLIINVADILKSIFRPENVYRIGGDEFVILLYNNECDNSNALMNKIKKHLESRKDGVSFATGISLYNSKKDKCVDDVFIRADIAMYERKKMMKRQNSKFL